MAPNNIVWLFVLLLGDTWIVNGDNKRILLTDPDFSTNQQLLHDVEVLKGSLGQLQAEVSTLKAQHQTDMSTLRTQYQTDVSTLKGQHQTEVAELNATINNLHSLVTSLQQNTKGTTYVIWGRKECSANGTDIVYSGIAGGGHYTDPGRNADPICLPHDPQLGPVKPDGAFGSVFGMEYETNAFGNDLVNKDVPCAVCRTRTASSVLIIPGRNRCYDGWKMEYSGNLMSGHHGHAGASNYLCVDASPDVLEAGARNDDGYLLYVVKAYCGALKCPPYKQDTTVTCVVCSK